MDILQLDELTDDMMNLRNDGFYNFLEVVLNKNLCELFRVQGIRDVFFIINNNWSNNASIYV